MSFGAPSGTMLTANTTYYFVIYTVGAFDLALEGTSAHAEDSGGQSGWTIADALRFQARNRYAQVERVGPPIVRVPSS